MTVSSIVRSGTALVTAALALSAIAAPALAAPAPVTIGDWQAAVEDRIDATLRSPGSVTDRRTVTLALAFDANGAATGAQIAKSSGRSEADAEALRVARTLHYPLLPMTLRGAPRTVMMEIHFGTTGDALAIEHARTEADRRTQDYARRIEGTVRQVNNSGATPAG